VDVERRLCGRSLVAAFCALPEGLPISNGLNTGGEFGWFSPFAVLFGIALWLGYAPLDTCWLVKKCEGDRREAAIDLAVGLFTFLVIVYALAEDLQVMRRWLERRYLFIFPVTGVIAAFVVARALAIAGTEFRSIWWG
jgi:cytochrome bd ubiquinol oxidase subunit II